MLTDAQWAELSPLLPRQSQSPGTTARDTRLFVKTVLWRARCGVLWRDLPAERFGPWHTVYARFRHWRQAGVWPRILAQVQNATGLLQLMVDSKGIRAHQVAAGAKKQPRRSGTRPQPGSFPVGRFHDQTPPERRRLRPGLCPGPDRGPGRRLPASPRPAAQPPTSGAGRVGRPGLRCGLRARPNGATWGQARDSREEKPDRPNRTRCRNVWLSDNFNGHSEMAMTRSRRC